MEDKKKNEQQQDFIVETPILIEERLGKGSDKTRKYERGKFLGKGGFAKCFEMKCVDTKKIYAAKVFEKRDLTNARSRKKLINEIKLHKKLHHQNIVNFEHFFEDKESVYILLELCSNQTMNELLKRRKRLTEIEVQCYLIQIIKALKYIHSHKIIHRDLKLGNCFITSRLELKLGDFGLAAKLEYEGQRRRTVCGTPNYIAPEILEKKNGHSFEVDIWSLGIVAYTLLFGRPPFETVDVKLTYKKIKMNNYSFPDNIKVHPSAKKLISSILNLDPSKRPSLDAILEHEFFRIYNSVPVLLPLSTLACPPSQKYISQFTKSDGNYFQNAGNGFNSHRYNNSANFNNTFSNFQYQFNSNGIDLNDLNNNLNSVENINAANNVSKDLINKLIQSSDNPFHRKSESLSKFQDEQQFIEKVNQILQNGNANVVTPSASRNVNKNNDHILSHKDLDCNNPNDKNIINNNFYINVANLNNMELKFDQNVINKIEDLPSTGVISRLNNRSLFFSKVTKYYDHSNKFGVVYFVNNTHMGICYNDNSNLLKNVSMTMTNTSGNNMMNNKNFQYLYIDKDGKNSLNYDEQDFESNSKEGSKDMLKKFEIFKHILKKYTQDFIAMTSENKANNNEAKLFFVKKFLKVQHGFLFRLSNKLIQVSFVDKTELIMSTDSSDLFYKTKNGEEVVDTIQNVMSSDNAELIKRVKYTKNLLIHFIKSQKSKKVPK